MIILQWSIDLGYEVYDFTGAPKLWPYTTHGPFRTRNISLQKEKIKEISEKYQIINFSGFVLRLLKSTGGVDGRALSLLSYERTLIR